MAGRLEGKVAIVTGAGCVGPGWGNGRATAVRFAEEGASVLACDISADALAETLERAGELGGSMTSQICDVLDKVSIKAMIDACMERYGRIDILVNNVGGSAKGGPVTLSEEDWDRQIAYNLKSVFMTCKHVLPHMEAAGRGAIINLASTSGLRWTGAAQVAYAATKAGLAMFAGTSLGGGVGGHCRVTDRMAGDDGRRGGADFPVNARDRRGPVPRHTRTKDRHCRLGRQQRHRRRHRPCGGRLAPRPVRVGFGLRGQPPAHRARRGGHPLARPGIARLRAPADRHLGQRIGRGWGAVAGLGPDRGTRAGLAGAC